MENFKFALKLDLDKYSKMCYKHNWFNKINNEYYDYFLNLYLPKYITETTIDEFAKIIKDLSSTDETVKEIRKCLETIIIVSEKGY